MGEGMMMRRGGGGSTALTIASGTAQPSSPKANTLWINTSTTLGKSAIQSSAPSTINGVAVANGDVWIKSATGANVLAVHKGIAYALDSAYVYNSGWVAAVAKYYDGSSWTFLGTILLNKNDTYAYLSGGWNAYAQANATMALGADGYVANNTATPYYCSGIQTVNSLDLTDALTIKALVYITGYYNNTYPLRFGAGGTQMTAANTESNIYSVLLSRVAVDSQYAELSVDVSSLVGSYKIGISGSMRGTIQKVWVTR